MRWAHGEALRLAVVQRAAAELQRDLGNAVIDGKTLHDRITQLADLVWGYYARPEFLAYMQVILNLSHDPTTEQQTRAAMDSNQIHMGQSIPKLLRDVIGNAAPAGFTEGAKLSTFVFGALRGMAIDQGHLEAMPTSRVDAATHAEQKRMLVASLAAYVEATIKASSKKR